MPKWLRVAPGACAAIRNEDSEPYAIAGGASVTALAAGETTTVCFSTPGVHRVRTGELPYSGGFVIVDRALA